MARDTQSAQITHKWDECKLILYNYQKIFIVITASECSIGRAIYKYMTNKKLKTIQHLKVILVLKSHTTKQSLTSGNWTNKCLMIVLNAWTQPYEPVRKRALNIEKKHSSSFLDERWFM